ncbi:MAG: carboxypeptidase regulatory-like domain-containing protein [Deltaproteobacteria bacterium]|nr:carboxypeptidase regulatory-like domain-containing protein [Deltaproteobacteria bacterium]
MQCLRHASFVIWNRAVFLGFTLFLTLIGRAALAQQVESVDQAKSTAEQEREVVSTEPTDAASTEKATEQPGPGAPASAPGKPDAVDMKKWKRRYRKYNTWEGSTGGMHLADPVSGAKGSVRIQIGVRGFGASDFLVEDDDVESIYQQLSISWTPTEFFELYGSLFNGSTAVDLTEYKSKREDPRFENTFHTHGDATLGIKAGAFVTPVLALGGDVSMILPNQRAAVGIQLDAVSVGVRGDLALDLRMLKEPVPFIGRFNLDYRFDHSEALIGDTEDKRYENYYADDPNPPTKQRDPEHLISRVERFGLGINRVDLFSLGLGVEIPLEVAKDFYLQPIVEWRMSFPVNRRDFVCPYREPQQESENTSDEALFADDSCGDKENASAYPSTLGFALRGVTPIRGVSAIFGIDVGLTGTSTFIRELKPTPPYEILFAASYDYDARPPDVRIVERKVQQEAPKGRIKGLVAHADSTATPIGGATIVFIGRELSPLSAGDDGRFASYEFAPGKVEMTVSHPDFRSNTCVAEIQPKGGDIEATCTLVPLPATGEIKGMVTDVWNNGVPGATVELSGTKNLVAVTNEDGRFEKPVEPGEYSVRIDAAGYLLKIGGVTVTSRETVSREFIMAKRPEQSSVSLKGDSIRIRTPITFDKESGKLSDKSALVVAEIADLILRNPQIRKVKVQGSTRDAKGDSMVALSRSLNIKHSLVNAGVAPELIEALGGEGPRVKITVEQE